MITITIKDPNGNMIPKSFNHAPTISECATEIGISLKDGVRFYAYVNESEAPQEGWLFRLSDGDIVAFREIPQG